MRQTRGPGYDLCPLYNHISKIIFTYDAHTHTHTQQSSINIYEQCTKICIV